MRSGAELLLVIGSMALITYAFRVAPLLVAGARLPPRLVEYLRVVAPAMLAGLAAVTVAVGVSEAGRADLHIGIEWLGVLASVALVVWRRNLLIGLVGAVVVVGGARALGIAA